MSNLDPQDPLARRFNTAAVTKRQIDNLLGMINGILLDGVVNDEEALGLRRWMEANRECSDQWPANVIYGRLQAMLADGTVSADEQGELLSLLMKTVGGPVSAEAPAAKSSALPLDDPLPAVNLSGAAVCVTGVFAIGPRQYVHHALERAGARILTGIRKDLDYLAIGSVGSEAWRHASFGSKIIKACEYRDAGTPIKIISEPHLLEVLGMR